MQAEVAEISLSREKKVVMNATEGATANVCRSRHVVHVSDAVSGSPTATEECLAPNGVDRAAAKLSSSASLDASLRMTQDWNQQPSPATHTPSQHAAAMNDAASIEPCVDDRTKHLIPMKSRCSRAGCANWYEKMATHGTVLKLVFTLSVVSLLLVAYSLVLTPWLLPYHFTFSAPVLFMQRALRYWKPKWQAFLLDFCYFGNVGLLIYLWACPASTQFFAVIFAVVNGPVAIATVVFRNSLVFHDADRMTSVFIHVVPMCVTYVVRWYPQFTSMYWYTTFSSTLASGVTNSSVGTDSSAVVSSVAFDMSLVWLIAVPLSWFTLHSLIYGLVEGNCIPEDYLTSYRWLTSNEKFLTYKILTLGGRRKTIWIFVAFQWLYAFVGTLLARLWYEYFVAHSLFLSVVGLCCVWNGASYYIDVFSKKGLPT